MNIFLLELGDLGGDDKLTVALVWIVGEVFLVIIFSWEEGFKRHKLSDDGFGKEILGTDLFDDGFSLGFLPRGGEEYGRTVLGAHIRALAVKGGRVVDGEEDVQQIRVGDEGRVEGDLHSLGMARGAAANLFIGGRRAFTARVARDDVCDPFDLVKDRFEAPEASTGENGLLELCIHKDNYSLNSLEKQIFPNHEKFVTHEKEQP
jgi:hypothetical protein